MEQFLTDGETWPDERDTTGMDVGVVDGHRVAYSQYNGRWQAHTIDLHGVFGGGKTREEAEQTMREAIAFHLDDSDQVTRRKGA
ncbi:MAG TPA: type II toxin-antitoxin system HicB family antitoxin [Chloroflexota bacterium]|nr:type II toxin-antitoxin system HicB family antitoxin [Chloroflexota bacterium]